MPLISVIIPCYNQAQYLDECLQSVLDQTYKNWECIIVNDGSPDHTEEVAKKWLEKDARFKYLYKENGGLSSARNAGIRAATGEWILPLDADDYISEDYCDLAKNYFGRHEFKVICCNGQKFGAINEKWKLPKFSLSQLAAENLIFCSAFFRKFDWQNIGGYDENLKIGYEDWDFWISLLKNGGQVLNLEKTCFYYRTKENSMLQNLKKSRDNSALMHIEKKHLAFFSEHLGTLHMNYNRYKEIEKVLDIVINKRFLSRWVNRIYSVLENYPKK